MHVNVKSVAGWWIVALASVVSLAAVNDTRLIDAVKDSNVKRVQALVREHVDVNATAADGATALHWAVHKDDLTTADLLIRAGARPRCRERSGRHTAAPGLHKSQHRYGQETADGQSESKRDTAAW